MENYEKLYKEAISRADKHYARHIVEDIFPELMESEDEKIRKGLIKGLSAMRDIHKHQTFSDDAINIDDALAWLEKQKPSDESLQYLKDNHSPSDISDFQAAMNVAVAKAFDAGKASVEKHNFVWSEEDEANMNAVWKACGQAYGIKYQSILGDWLKSLKPNYWKPSEEQILSLQEAISIIGENSISGRNLIEILEQLNNL